MISINIARRTRLAAGSAIIILGTLATAACGGTKGQHAVDADTGAAAPSTVRDMSATPGVPDSTPGVAAATGRPDAASSDTMGTRGKAGGKAVKPPGTP
jgi:hypothetical protein